jgi:hypothetical protein
MKAVDIKKVTCMVTGVIGVNRSGWYDKAQEGVDQEMMN